MYESFDAGLLRHERALEKLSETEPEAGDLLRFTRAEGRKLAEENREFYEESPAEALEILDSQCYEMLRDMLSTDVSQPNAIAITAVFARAARMAWRT